MSKWIDRWKVPSSNGRKMYTVSVTSTGEYGCSCLGWTQHVPRRDCKHITQVRAEKYYGLNMVTAEMTDRIVRAARSVASMPVAIPKLKLRPTDLLPEAKGVFLARPVRVLFDD